MNQFSGCPDFFHLQIFTSLLNPVLKCSNLSYFSFARRGPNHNQLISATSNYICFFRMIFKNGSAYTKEKMSCWHNELFVRWFALKCLKIFLGFNYKTKNPQTTFLSISNIKPKYFHFSSNTTHTKHLDKCIDRNEKVKIKLVSHQLQCPFCGNSSLTLHPNLTFYS